MAINVFFREHRHLGRTTQSDSVPILYEDGTEIDTVKDVTAAAAFTLDAKTAWLEIIGSAGFSYVLSPVAAAVAATAANLRVPANVPRIIRVPEIVNVPGQAPAPLYQVSAISNP